MASSVESGSELIARLAKKPSLEGRLEPALFPDGPKHGSVYELYGGEGTGKTQMLIHLITRCILPTEWNQLPLGGLGICVVFIDTDFHLSLIRLTSVLESCIMNCLNTNNDDTVRARANETEVEALVKECLERLYLVQCKSSSQLYITLDYLDNLLGCKPDIGVLIIDSISAFYWIDKYAGGDSFQAQEENMRNIANVVERLAKTYNLVVFATKSLIFQKNRYHDLTSSEIHPVNPDVRQHSMLSVAPNLQHCEYLCRSWTKIITKRLLFSKEISQSSNQTQLFSVQLDTNTTKSKLYFTINRNGISFLS